MKKLTWVTLVVILSQQRRVKTYELVSRQHI